MKEKLKIAPEMNRKLSITPSIVVSSELSPAVAPKQITNVDIEKDGNLLCPKYRSFNFTLSEKKTNMISF